MSRYSANLCLLFLLSLFNFAQSFSRQQITIPGCDSQKATVGYLIAGGQQNIRQIHYVLIKTDNQQTSSNSNDPLTLWMNGGPGCSSKYGFLQQIGPCILQPYKDYESTLLKNSYSWHKQSNLLFLDSPAGVGYSINNDKQYVYSDSNTAEDNFRALLDFFDNEQGFGDLKKRNFYLAGQSYAGKYIPDLALKINSYNIINPQSPINLRGILLGNAVMDWSQNSLDNSRVNYMISHNFIDPKLLSNWQNSCQTDEQSAGCQFFKRRYEDILYRTNPYNIYGICSNKAGNSLTQGSFLHKISQRKFNTQTTNLQESRFQYCSYDAGIQKYFTTNKDTFKSNSTVSFKLCNDTIFNSYEVTVSGIMNQLPRIISDTAIRVHYFSGDWDDVVPFTDTIANIQKLGFRQTSMSAWTLNDQNIGMKRIYSIGQRNITFWMVKKAGHQVPMYQRQASFQLFKGFLTAK